MTIFWIILSIFILGVIIFWIISIHNKPKGKSSNKDLFKQIGDDGEEIVNHWISSYLRRMGIKHKLYKDVYLRDGDYVTQVDHILITQKRIYIIETKWHSWEKCRVYGKWDSEKWEIKSLNGKHLNYMDNPYFQNKHHCNFFMNILNKNRVYDFKNYFLKNVVILKNTDNARIVGRSIYNKECLMVDVDTFLETIVYDNKHLNSIWDKVICSVIDILEKQIENKEENKTLHQNRNHY